jgi:hypothetical protein
MANRVRGSGNARIWETSKPSAYTASAAPATITENPHRDQAQAGERLRHGAEPVDQDLVRRSSGGPSHLRVARWRRSSRLPVAASNAAFAKR